MSQDDSNRSDADMIASDPSRDNDLALAPPAIDYEPGREYADEARDVNMVLGATQTRGGRLWAVWVSGGDSELGYFVLATSDDGGDTWSDPRMVIDPSNHPTGMPRRTLVGNLWTDPVGRLWLFFDMAMGYFDGRGGVWAITCDEPDADQPRWSTPRRIWHGATLNKPTVLADGTWLLPISLWRRERIIGTNESGRPTIDPSTVPADFHEQYKQLDPLRAAHVFASTDNGETWSRRGHVTFPNFRFDEHMFVELPGGRIWMLARTSDGIYESFSSDQGHTWTEPRKRFENVSARFFIRRLASGRILFVKYGPIDQNIERRSHLTPICLKMKVRPGAAGLCWTNARKSPTPTGLNRRTG